MAEFLTVDGFVEEIGVEEALQIAGVGPWNAPEPPALDTAKVERALAFADDLIAGHCLGRHPWLKDLAPEAMPSLIAGVAADLARYRLRDKAGGKGQVSETVRERYEDALKALAAIQRGTTDLVAPAGVTTAEAPDTGIGHVRSADVTPRAGAVLEGW